MRKELFGGDLGAARVIKIDNLRDTVAGKSPSLTS